MPENDLGLETDKTYRIETFLNQLRAIDRLTSTDGASVVFIAKGGVDTPMGPIPIHVKLEGVSTIEEAYKAYDTAISTVAENVIRQIESRKKKIISPDDLRRMDEGLGGGNGGRLRL